jgi:hypothetical protein
MGGGEWDSRSTEVYLLGACGDIWIYWVKTARSTLGNARRCYRTKSHVETIYSVTADDRNAANPITVTPLPVYHHVREAVLGQKTAAREEPRRW